MRLALRLILLGALALGGSIIPASTASNNVPSSKAGSSSIARTIAQLLPPQCAGMSPTTLVTGAGILTGTSGSDLILGSAGADTIDGLGGDDCIVGGAGIDSITGGLGTDTCLAKDPLSSILCEVIHLL
ncbi:MAG: hypothetical protein ACLGH3_00595 [Actinomycetota bacterium]